VLGIALYDLSVRATSLPMNSQASEASSIGSDDSGMIRCEASAEVIQGRDIFKV
jgi:hypothetical protein